MNPTDLVRGTAISLRQAVDMHTPKAIELWLDVVDEPAERAHQVTGLSAKECGRLGEQLDTTSAVELFDSIDSDLAAKVLDSQPNSRSAELLAGLDADRAADIARRFKRERREQVLSAMSLDHAKVLRALLSWPDDAVAAHMTPDALTVSPSTTASAAVAEIRSRATTQREGLYAGVYIYVADSEMKLLGRIRFRSLVLADANDAAGELLEEDRVTVSALTDAEEAANLLIDRRLRELPVLDADGRLLGVLTERHALDIAEQATTEDAERQGGSAPLEKPYLRASPWYLWRKRIIWLLVLFVAEAYTGTVLRAFEDEMEAVVALAFFIPLLIGTGGNTGTQITTTLVRAMGTGQVRFRDMPAVVAKELSTGALIAMAMALAALIRAWTLGVGPQVTLTVSLTVAAIVLWSALVSSILPLVLKKIRIDPAVVSAPLIATIVDGTGLMIYFVIAHATLPQLAGL
jgi:magnesium transporter